MATSPKKCPTCGQSMAAKPAPPNPNVARIPSDFGTRAAGTAGRAVDPLSGQPMIKGRPVAAQSMSPIAQGARQFGYSVDDAILGPFQKKKKKK